MNIKWKYKIDLANEEVFSEIAKERGISIPVDVVNLIKEGNAATPEKYNYVVGSTEKVLGAILSFNRGEEGTDTVFTALESIDDKNLLPFAIDSFGNYICLDIRRGVVVLLDHETDRVDSTDKDIVSFMESLY